MTWNLRLLLALSVTLWITGCGGSDHGHDHGDHDHDHSDGTHAHDDGSNHSDHADAGSHTDHDVQALVDAVIGDMNVELAQGHGAVQAGKESHLVVVLPYNDKGGSIVRAWIGGEDRTLSMVSKGDYNAGKNRYDIHATAPDPLPEATLWWIEIEKPDGTKLIGSTKPITQ